MKIPQLSLGFPLLVKELTELAARRRTYLVRVGYAMLMFLGALFYFWEQILSQSLSSLAMLGQGQHLFTAIVYIQFAGIYLFLPAMTCSALAAEKERDTFALLMLTRLGPWTIIFEKLISRLIPMLTFLLLSLPLLAFAYSYGGVQQDEIWGAFLILGLTAFQIASLSIMCSAYCRTTAGAFVATYVVGALIIPVLLLILFTLGIVNANVYFTIAAMAGPFVYMGLFDSVIVFSSSTAVNFLVWCLPLIITSMIFLGLSRYFLVRRAFLQPRHLLRRIFQGLDKIFWKINHNKVTRGVILVNESSTLPEDKPVQWREIAKKNLSQFRYLLRIFLVLEFPIALICILVLTTFAGVRNQMQLEAISVVLYILWIIAALILTVQSASLISSERSRQTFDVLLTTPLSGREIVLQKMRGMRRLMYVLGASFLTIFLSEVWWYGSAGISGGDAFSPRFTSYYGQDFLVYYSPARYLVTSLLCVFIYLPLIAWVGMCVGLRVKSQTRAILGSLAVLISWCVLTIAVVVSIFEVISPTLNEELLALVSPMSIIPMNEYNSFGQADGFFAGVDRGYLFRWCVVLGNFAFYGLMLYLIRTSCLRHADRYLNRRVDEKTVAPEAVAQPESLELETAAS